MYLLNQNLRKLPSEKTKESRKAVQSRNESVRLPAVVRPVRPFRGLDVWKVAVSSVYLWFVAGLEAYFFIFVHTLTYVIGARVPQTSHSPRSVCLCTCVRAVYSLTASTVLTG